MRERRRRQFAVQFGAARSELQHVAENRDAPAERADTGLTEQRERCAHRGGVGVIAFVDQERRTARHVQRHAGAAPARRLQVCERECRQCKIGAGQRGGR